MTSNRPPSLARWLLERFSGNDALVGDLVEGVRSGRPATWFWKQTIAAIVVRQSAAVLSLAGLVALFVVGRSITVPGVNTAALAALSRGTEGSFRVYDLLTGGNLAPLSVLALAILPYASAATIVELAAWLSRAIRDRPPSPHHIVRVARTLAVLLAATQALGLTLFLERQSAVAGGLTLVAHPGWAFRIPAIFALMLATGCLMWTSDRLSTSRTANGMLVVVAAGLLAGLPRLPAVSVGMLLRLAMSIAVVTLTAWAYRRDLCASLG
jgi:preprotein translocase subunit SecY